LESFISKTTPYQQSKGMTLPRKNELAILALILSAAFVVRLLLFQIPGCYFDMATFSGWIGAAFNHGIRPFYDATAYPCDYPPLNVYLFYSLGQTANQFGLYNMQDVFNVVKFLPNLFDLFTAGLIYYFVRKNSSFKMGILAAGIYAFNPAIVFDGAIWGQWDAIYTFLIVASLLLVLKNKPKSAAIVFALSILTKPQAIALAPLLAFLIYKKNGVKNFIFSAAAFTATVFVVILPFQWSNPVTFLSNIYFGALGKFSFTTDNAFNLWGIFGLCQPDTYFFVLGWVMLGVFTLAVLYVLNKRVHASDEVFVVFCAFLLFFGFFMFPTRIHERYLFPTIALLALTIPFIKKTRPIYIILTGTLLFNQAIIWEILNYKYSVPNGYYWVIPLTGVINVAVLVYSVFLMLNKAKENLPLKTQGTLNKIEGFADNFFIGLRGLFDKEEKKK
jgi:Gpi18-like mannosyltransferase